jgi:LPXTG-motif cell wall-anchored protein
VTAADTVNLEFVDDFDERMEYVQGSLKLELKTYETTSSPGQLVDTFYYKGGATGSGSLCATADAFVNSQGKTLKEYAAARGGTSWYNFFFTYQLRVKDIYKYIVATKLQLDNKATLRWGTDETQTLSADETVTYKTDLLTKRILDAPEEGETLGNGNILNYQIELNPREADLDPNSDVLTILDTLPDCLNVIWDNENQNNVIGEYWDEEAGWVSFEDAKDKTWQKGYYYDKSLGKNVLRFQIPDSCHVRITYGCQVTEYGTSVEITNQVSILGQTTLEDSVSSVFHVNVKTGSAESDEQQFAIIKTDSTSHEPLEHVKFVLYSQESRTNRVPEEEGIPAEISGKDGRAYYYFGTYETDSNGYCLVQGLNNGGKYILREYEAPAGYTKMEDKYIQYTENPLEDSKLTENFDNVFKNQTLSIVNEAFLLPETGGAGRIALYGLAVLLVLAGAGYLLRKKKI